MTGDGGNADAMLGRFTQAGIDIEAVALQLQRDGAQAFVKSWQELLACIADKTTTFAGSGSGAGAGAGAGEGTT
jgi:transaldolase